MFRPVAACLIALLLPAVPALALTTVTNLNDSGAGSLRQALLDEPSGGEIDFDSGLSGTLTLTSAGLTIPDDLTITGPGADEITIDGDDMFRVFTIADGDVTITGLTITGGDTTGSGGGIEVPADASLSLVDCTISDCSADTDGGGLYATDATVTLTRVTISGCTATGDGGAIAVDTSSVLNLFDTTLTGNTGATGGGVAIDESTVTGVDVTIDTSTGGAVAITGTSPVAGFTNSTFSGNPGGSNDGGGIAIDAGTLTLINCTLTLNSTNGTGGGVMITAGTVSLTNTLIAGNTATTDSPDINGTVISTSSGNLIGDGDDLTGISDGVNDNQVGTSGAPIDAMLGTLGDNSGPVETHLPAAGSPALDAGDDSGAASIDARGVERPDNGQSDVGAVERATANDAPVISGSDESAAEATDVIFSTANSNALTITDDALPTQSIQVMLTVTDGTLTLASTEGITFDSGSNGSASMTISATTSDLATALDGLTYSPPTTFNDDATLTVDTDDMGNFSDVGDPAAMSMDSFTIRIGEPVITAPESIDTLEAEPVSFAGGDVIAITDGDADDDGVEVSLTVSNGILTLADTTGLTFSTGASAEAAMVFTGDLDDVNNALDGMVYTPDSGFNGSDTLAIEVDDMDEGAGQAFTVSANVAINVIATNDAPVISVPGQQEVEEQRQLVFSDATGNAITFTDEDADGGEMEITLEAEGGTFTLGSTTGVTFVSGDGTDDETIVFTATVEDGNAALEGLRWKSPSGTGLTTLTITIDDQGNTGGSAQTAEADIVVDVYPDENGLPLTVSRALLLGLMVLGSLAVVGRRH